MKPLIRPMQLGICTISYVICPISLYIRPVSDEFCPVKTVDPRPRSFSRRSDPFFCAEKTAFSAKEFMISEAQ